MKKISRTQAIEKTIDNILEIYKNGDGYYEKLPYGDEKFVKYDIEFLTMNESLKKRNYEEAVKYYFSKHLRKFTG